MSGHQGDDVAQDHQHPGGQVELVLRAIIGISW
jgi:hypothetical protein